MKKPLFVKAKNAMPSDIVETRVFQNKNNKQFNLSVLKKSTSPDIIKDILKNKDVVGLKFKITDVLLKKDAKLNSGNL